MMLAVDTETTGLDFWHGTAPFFVSTCDEQGEQRYWEWSVDPRTRRVQRPDGDAEEIAKYLRSFDRLVLHNAKFDYHALRVADVWRSYDVDEAWRVSVDTLMAAHLLDSNKRKNLTDLVIRYVGHDIESLEKKLHDSVHKARRICNSKAFREDQGEWRISRETDDESPSARGDGAFKADYWLPRELWRRVRWVRDEHPEFQTALREYANADTAATLALWQVMEREIERRQLGRIFAERMRVLPIAWHMENRGITFFKDRLATLRDEYETESARLRDVCESIARGLNYELTLPKGASPNQSLKTFMWDVMKFPRVKDPKKGNDSLARAVIDGYLETETGPRLKFLEALQAKRKRDSNVAYMAGYERFAIDHPEHDAIGVLHPRLNPTATDTLRWSSSNPNEQNISKKEVTKGDGRSLRYLFGPAPGREWWSLDAKNMELRIPAYESGEQDLIDLFERPDDPPFYGSEHLLNFSVAYPDIWEAEIAAVGLEKVGPYVKKKYETTNYHWAKCGGFAIGYGAIDRAGGAGTADRAFRRPGTHARLKSRFAKKEALNQRYIAQATRLGYVETIPDRSVDPERGYPLSCRNEYGSVKPTLPLNYHVQSTAMWWTMRAMIRVQALLDHWRDETGFDGHIALQVHDELVIDLPRRGDPVADRELERAGRDVRRLGSNLGRIRAIQREMERGGEDIGVKTPTGCEYHADNWGEGVTL